MKNLLTLCAFFFLSISVQAQSFSVRGKVQDSTCKGVPFASVAITDPADTSTIAFTISDDAGNFQLRNIDSGSYLLFVASFGFDVLYKDVEVTKDREGLILDMSSTAVSFKEIMVRASKMPILLNGDTVVYNSSSFKTQSNANVEDLIKKMPGIQVNKDGTIMVEGKQVSKILVNGKEFFGGNVEAATKNLDAALVDKVEVIDKKTDEDEFTGEDAEDREKVINLVLKEEHTRGYFGTIRAGYGSREFYDIHGNMNFFDQNSQLSIIGGLNNMDKRLYGWRDMATLQNFEISPFNQSNRITWWNGGVSTNKGVGVNYHISPSKWIKTDVSYIITNEVPIRRTSRNSEVYLTNSTLFSSSSEQMDATNNAHELNAKVEMEPDTLNRIVVRAKYSKQFSESEERSLAFNYTNLENILNSGVNSDAIDAGNESFAVKAHWTRKNRKRPDDHFLGSIYVGGADVTNVRQSYFNTDTSLLPFPSNEQALLEQDLHTKEQTVAITAAYQFKISEKWSLRPGINALRSVYEHEFTWEPKDQEALLAKSPKGTVEAYNIEYFAHFRYQLDSFTSIHVIPEINQSIEDRRFTTDQEYSYRFSQPFLIPYMFIRSARQHKYYFNLSVHANVRRPDVTQILPVVDNSDPYRVNIGNIELQNYMNYSNSINYRKTFGLGKNVGVNIWNNFNLFPVVNKNYISEENYVVSQVENFKFSYGNYNNLFFNAPWSKIKAVLGVNFGFNNSQSYFIRNDEELAINNRSFDIEPNIQFNEFDLWSLDLEYAISKNFGSIGDQKNNDYISQSIDAELIITPFDRLEWGTELYWEFYGSNSAVGAASIPILTSEVNVFIDKDQRWSVGAKVFDIFDKNQNLWRWWSANSFTENRTNAVQRYVMATVSYKIRKPNKEPNSNM